MKVALDQKLKRVLPFFNEKQQRIYLASESEYIGFGGVTAVSEASGVSRPTIILGKKEIQEGIIDLPNERIRKKEEKGKSYLKKIPKFY